MAERWLLGRVPYREATGALRAVAFCIDRDIDCVHVLRVLRDGRQVVLFSKFAELVRYGFQLLELFHQVARSPQRCSDFAFHCNFPSFTSLA